MSKIKDGQRDKLFKYYSKRVTRRLLIDLPKHEPTNEQLDNPQLMTNENWAWYQDNG